jgi:hypothetical protein
MIDDIAKEHDDSGVSSSPLKEKSRKIPKPLLPEDANPAIGSENKKHVLEQI